jgi:hypothetical protein
MCRVRGRTVDQRNRNDRSRNSDIDDTAVRVDSGVLSGSPFDRAEDELKADIACEHEYTCCDHRPDNILPSGTDKSSCKSGDKLLNPSVGTDRPPQTRPYSKYRLERYRKPPLFIILSLPCS